MLTVSQLLQEPLCTVHCAVYSKCTLSSSVSHNISISTGFLLHFSNLCLGCVFYKTKRSATFFLFSLNERETQRSIKLIMQNV